MKDYELWAQAQIAAIVEYFGAVNEPHNIDDINGKIADENDRD